MSRSRLIPGKTTTADFMASIWVRAACPATGSSGHLDAEILDHGVGEQLLGRAFERRLGLGLVATLDLYVEHLALPHARHAGDAERFERALDRLALRVEN